MVKLLLGEVVLALIIEVKVTFKVWFDIWLVEEFIEVKITLFSNELIEIVGLEFNEVPEITPLNVAGRII